MSKKPEKSKPSGSLTRKPPGKRSTKSSESRSKNHSEKGTPLLADNAPKTKAGSLKADPVGNEKKFPFRPLAKHPKLLSVLITAFVIWLGLLIYLAIRVNS